MVRLLCRCSCLTLVTNSGLKLQLAAQYLMFYEEDGKRIYTLKASSTHLHATFYCRIAPPAV